MRQGNPPAKGGEQGLHPAGSRERCTGNCIGQPGGPGWRGLVRRAPSPE